MNGESENELMAMVMEMNRRGQETTVQMMDIQRKQQETLTRLEVNYDHIVETMKDFKDMYTDTVKRNEQHETKTDDRITALAIEYNNRISDLEKVVVKNTFIGSIASKIGTIVITAAGTTLIVWLLGQMGVTK